MNANKNILLVEDDKDDQEFFIAALSEIDLATSRALRHSVSVANLVFQERVGHSRPRRNQTGGRTR